MLPENEKTLAALLLALGVILALYLPEVSHFFAPYLLHSLFFVMVFSLLPFARLEGSRLFRLHPAVVSLVCWQQVLLPLIVVSLGKFISADAQLIYFVILTLTSGSLFASPTLVQLMGLDQRMAVQTVIFSTLAAPISIYAFFSFLHAGPVDLNLMEFGIRLFWFLIIPIAIFFAVRVTISSWSELAKDRIDRMGRWGSVLALIVFCFALEDQVTYLIEKDAGIVIWYLIIAISVIAFVAVSTRIVMSRFGGRIALTASVLASFRNVGLTFGLVGSIAGPEIAVYVGVCQIPMFCAPLLFDLFIGKADLEGSEAIAAHASGKKGNPDPARSGGFQELHRAGAIQHNSTVRLTPKGLATMESRNPNPINAGLAYDGNAAIARQVDPHQETKIALHQQPAIALAEETTVVVSKRERELEQKFEDVRTLLVRLERELTRSGVIVKERAGTYLTLFAGLVLLSIAGIWQANKHVFPMLFDQQMIEDVAEAHIAEQNYGVFDLNINIRDLRNETIKRMESTPELVVLGASHWQEAHVDLLPDYDFYNSHVHRDYYEDMMAVTEMWVRHDKLPGEMIITIRDNLLTPISDRTDFLWLPGIKYYRDFAARIGYEPHAWWETLPTNTWQELVSLPLFWTQATRHFLAPTMPHATEEREFETLDVLLPGGSILWSGQHKRLFSQERARSEALAFAESKRNNPPKIDPKGIQHMEALFDFLVSKKVKVTLAHPQFNPVFWEAVQGSPYIEGLKAVEEQTVAWSERYGFPVIGGFAPEAVGCRAEQYIDAEHGNPDCLGKLLAQYRTPGAPVQVSNLAK